MLTAPYWLKTAPHLVPSSALGGHFCNLVAPGNVEGCSFASISRDAGTDAPDLTHCGATSAGAATSSLKI